VHVQRLVSVVKLATVLEKCTTEEQRSVVHFLWAKELSAMDIYKEMLNRIVTGGKSWVHYYQPESKRTSLQWKHITSLSAKKCKDMPSAGKNMLTVFGILK
jgi:hypothetical protein